MSVRGDPDEDVLRAEWSPDTIYDYGRALDLVDWTRDEAHDVYDAHPTPPVGWLMTLHFPCGERSPVCYTQRVLTFWDEDTLRDAHGDALVGTSARDDVDDARRCRERVVQRVDAFDDYGDASMWIEQVRDDVRADFCARQRAAAGAAP